MGSRTFVLGDKPTTADFERDALPNGLAEADLDEGYGDKCADRLMPAFSELGAWHRGDSRSLGTGPLNIGSCLHSEILREPKILGFPHSQILPVSHSFFVC